MALENSLILSRPPPGPRFERPETPRRPGGRGPAASNIVTVKGYRKSIRGEAGEGRGHLFGLQC